MRWIKTNMKIQFCSSSFFFFFFFFFFFCFFFSSTGTHIYSCSSKTICCMQILYLPNDCSTTGHLPFLVFGDVQATNGELWPRNCFLNATPSRSDTFLVSRAYNLGRGTYMSGVYGQTTPGLYTEPVRYRILTRL